MEQIKKFGEKHLFYGIAVSSSGIPTILERFKAHLLKKQRIPSVINLEKQYDHFSFSILPTVNTGDINPEHNCVILLNVSDEAINDLDLTAEQDSTLSNINFQLTQVELTLNASFYSHSELIKMFTNGEIDFSAYEIVGDIVHLNLTDEQKKYKELIGDVIHYKTGKTVINKTGKIEEVFRYYPIEVLAGEPKLTTIHKENGISFYLDLSKVYWCSRLQSERIRIYKTIKRGEVVCDPFCGAGPHVVPALKKGCEVYCNDLNQDAIECLKKTLSINKLECNSIDNIDAGAYLEKIKNKKIDHFIFNLPEYSLDYIKYTEDFASSFTLHVFFFCKSDVDVNVYIQERTGYKTLKNWLREVRKVSPSKSVYKLEVDSDSFFKFQSS